jgi:hypothetical protein
MYGDGGPSASTAAAGSQAIVTGSESQLVSLISGLVGENLSSVVENVNP